MATATQVSAAQFHQDVSTKTDVRRSEIFSTRLEKEACLSHLECDKATEGRHPPRPLRKDLRAGPTLCHHQRAAEARPGCRDHCSSCGAAGMTMQGVTCWISDSGSGVLSLGC